MNNESLTNDVNEILEPLEWLIAGEDFEQLEELPSVEESDTVTLNDEDVTDVSTGLETLPIQVINTKEMAELLQRFSEDYRPTVKMPAAYAQSILAL